MGALFDVELENCRAFYAAYHNEAPSHLYAIIGTLLRLTDAAIAKRDEARLAGARVGVECAAQKAKETFGCQNGSLAEQGNLVGKIYANAIRAIPDAELLKALEK